MSLRVNFNTVLRVGIGALLFLIPSTCVGQMIGVSKTGQRSPAVTQTPANESQPAGVVSIEPRCPFEPPPPAKPGERSATVPVRVRYNPSVPGAKLTAPESLTISLAINASYYANSQRTFAMSRTADGAWEATIPLEAYWSFLIFFVQIKTTASTAIKGTIGRFFHVVRQKEHREKVFETSSFSS
jgi:hypothetical protein